MRGEEGVGERQREEEDVMKTGSSGQSTCHGRGSCFLSPSPPLLPSISFVWQQEGHPKGKERVLKIPPSFLCPSPLLKTCCLHSNRPCLHTELIQLVVMNVCVWDRGGERVCAAAHVLPCQRVCVCVVVFFRWSQSIFGQFEDILWKERWLVSGQ